MLNLQKTLDLSHSSSLYAIFSYRIENVENGNSLGVSQKLRLF